MTENTEDDTHLCCSDVENLQIRGGAVKQCLLTFAPLSLTGSLPHLSSQLPHHLHPHKLNLGPWLLRTSSTSVIYFSWKIFCMTDRSYRKLFRIMRWWYSPRVIALFARGPRTSFKTTTDPSSQPSLSKQKLFLANSAVLKILSRLDERGDGSEIQRYLMELTKQRTVPNIFVGSYSDYLPMSMFMTYALLSLTAQKHIGGMCTRSKTGHFTEVWTVHFQVAMTLSGPRKTGRWVGCSSENIYGRQRYSRSLKFVVEQQNSSLLSAHSSYKIEISWCHGCLFRIWQIATLPVISQCHPASE